MKRLLTLMVIALSCATMTQAQDCNNCQKHKGAPTDLAQKKTDDMVAQYDLNADQAAKLLALNKEYAAKLSPRAPRHHHHGAAPAHQCKKGEAHQCKQGEAHQCKQGKPEGKDCGKQGEAHQCKQGKPHGQHHKPKGK